MLFAKNIRYAGTALIVFLLINISNAGQTVIANDYDHSLIISLLKSKDWRVRRKAAVHLGKDRVAGAADALIEAAKDERNEVRKEAAAALGKIGRINAMKPAKYRFDESGRREQYTGSVIFIDKEPIIKALSEMVNDNDEEVRAAVMKALAETYEDPAIKLAITGLKDKSVLVRKGALEGLAISNSPSVLEAVKKVLNDPDLKETAEKTFQQIKKNIDKAERIKWDREHPR